MHMGCWLDLGKFILIVLCYIEALKQKIQFIFIFISQN